MKDIQATVIVDLVPSEKEILDGLHKDARWGINKAIKSGLSVEQSNKEEDWNDFYEIYKKTIVAGGAPIDTLGHIKEYGPVFLVCKKEGKVVAGATLFLREGKPPKLTRNASLKEYQALQPNNLLYWHCILWSKANGYTELDLGGWQINAHGHLEGINKFKEKWGKVVYSENEYSTYKAIGRKIVRNSPLLGKLYNKIKIRLKNKRI